MKTYIISFEEKRKHGPNIKFGWEIEAESEEKATEKVLSVVSKPLRLSIKEKV